MEKKGKGMLKGTESIFGAAWCGAFVPRRGVRMHCPQSGKALNTRPRSLASFIERDLNR